jgi:transcriptional regulator with XRE-family HTH domain
MRALEESIRRDGVKYPILILPDGRIIDGYHRWRIAGDECPYEVLNISEDKAFILGIALNLARRHLSFEQIREIHERLRHNKELRKQVAIELRKQGKTQAEVAAIVGVHPRTVDEWESDISNFKNENANTPDLRYKIPKGAQEEIYKRYKSGESQKKLAVEFKISQGRVSQIVKKIEREKERAAKEAEEVKRAEVEAVVVHADALKWLHTLEDASFDCLLTDPPYSTDGVR